MADEMGNLADIFVIVPPIGHAAKHRGNEYRKHIDEHDEVETLAVQRRHARQDERYDQNGQLYAEVFHRVFKVGSPKQAYDVHEVEGYQEDGGGVLPEAGELRLEIVMKIDSIRTNLAWNDIFITISHNAINEPDEDEPELRHAHEEGREGEADGHHQQAQKIGLVQIGSYGSLLRHHLPLKMLWYSSLSLVLSRISKARFRSGSSCNEATMRPFW